MRLLAKTAIAAVLLGGPLGAAIVAATPAGAAPASSYTQTVYQTWDINNTAIAPAVNPCTGDPATGTARTNLVNHVTLQGGDNVWATFTETDDVSITDTGTGETYAGELTFWGNFNLNEQNQNSEFTGNGELRGDQGDSIGFHEVAVFAETATGQVTVNFDNPTFTCG